MAEQKVTDEEFIEAWKVHRSPQKVADAVGLPIRNVYSRRRACEERYDILLKADNKDPSNRNDTFVPKDGARHILDNIKGVVIVYNDAHIWPGDRSIASKALMLLIEDMKPKVIVDNGDSFDGARISRHPPAGWEHTPDVADELEAVKEHKAEIETLSPRGCKLLWNFGNHDSRFSMRLAACAPEFVNVRGMDLKDHFPKWSVAWSTMVNDSCFIKHRFKGGIHATWNNALWAGKTIVTGHLHQNKITPAPDLNGLKWGVDPGTLSDLGPKELKFLYTEDNPTIWVSGFAVLTFDKTGMLLPPELVTVLNGKAYFRGQVVC